MAPEKPSGSSGKRPTTSKFKPHRPSGSTARGTNLAVADGRETQPPSLESTPAIPPELLTRLLHEFFEDDRTRMSIDANALVAKYMETFVKEAIARAAIERKQSSDSSDQFLEVEDLEKLAPQLLLDF